MALLIMIIQPIPQGYVYTVIITRKYAYRLLAIKLNKKIIKKRALACDMIFLLNYTGVYIFSETVIMTKNLLNALLSSNFKF